jgi:hypothetical protein
VWGCVSNSVAATPTSEPRKIKEVLRITATTDWDQWEHRPCGAASVQDQELPIAAKWAGVNQADNLLHHSPKMYCHHFATSDAKAFRISDCEIPNCRAMRDGVTPALKAARTALSFPGVNATGTGSL